MTTTVKWPSAERPFRKTWLSLSRAFQPELLPELLSTFTARAFDPKHAEPPRTRHMQERIGAMARWPPDRRVAERLRTFIAEEAVRGRDGIATADLLIPALRVLVAQGDGETAPWLERFVSHNPAKIELLRTALVRAARPLMKRVLPARAAAPVPGKPRASASPDELFSAALSAPDDLERLAVLADAWLDRSDARGEFLALELAAERRPLTEVEQAKREKLQRALLPRLLGTLAPVVRLPTFRRGFVDGVCLVATSRAAPRVWQEARASPLLATVRFIDAGEAYDETFLDLAAAAPALRSVAVGVRQLGPLAASALAPRVESLVVRGRATRHVAGQLAQFPKLVELVVTAEDGSEEADAWARAAPTVRRFVATVPVVTARRDVDARHQTIVEPMLRLLRSTKIGSVVLNEWCLERDGRLAWVGAPIRTAYEAWTLVAFRAQREIPLTAESVALADRLVGETPAFRKALGTRR